MGYKKVDRETASEMYGAGKPVMAVDKNVGDMATPPLASDFLLESDSMEFFAKEA